MSVAQLLCIVADEKLCKLYEDFLRKNMAWENFGFKKAVERFKSAGDNKLKCIAEEIYDTFVREDADHELGDIDLTTRTDIENNINQPTREMFDQLYDVATESLAASTVTDFLKANPVRVTQSKSSNQDRRRGILGSIRASILSKFS